MEYKMGPRAHKKNEINQRLETNISGIKTKLRV